MKSNAPSSLFKVRIRYQWLPVRIRYQGSNNIPMASSSSLAAVSGEKNSKIASSSSLAAISGENNSKIPMACGSSLAVISHEKNSKIPMASNSSLAAISRETNSKIPMASGSSLAAISGEKNSKIPMAFGSSLAAISREKNSKIPMASNSSLAAISRETNSKIPMGSGSSLTAISGEKNSKTPIASGSSLAAISREKNSKIPMASGSSLAVISCEKNGSDSYSYYWKKHLPPGQRFQPTLQELTCFYLYSKFLPIQIPPGIVSSVDDIYDYEPHELPALAFKHDGGKMYFFTSLRKKFANGNKVKRDIKGNRGYWKATQARKDVKGCTGTTVGTTTPLTYYNKDAVKTPWLMIEHRLTDDLIARFKPKEDREPVLCTVYYHIRKKESGADGDGTEDPSPSP
ncbi:hypothetical protein RJ639_044483 [Escallonia herrerae]|uniref:NAC domain-containing protein n=1 Tax=Escallonia herrerae TaxID=1293975 RepID=A0AA89B9B1_9ASTE|nr:hypothetical protein RJ639_044483 [Escallonia herrerae]